MAARCEVAHTASRQEPLLGRQAQQDQAPALPGLFPAPCSPVEFPDRPVTIGRNTCLAQRQFGFVFTP